MRNIQRIGSMKNQRLLILLPILVLLLQAMITPIQAADLDTYAETYAWARWSQYNFAGPTPLSSRSSSMSAGQSAWGWYIVGAVSDVYVTRVGGVAWGPDPLSPVWPVYGGIGCYGVGFGPMVGAGSAVGWFESNTNFNVAVQGASVLISASGGTNGKFVMGVNVTDMSGATILYDVAIECGMNRSSGYFREINRVGTWPQPWVVSPPGSPLILATQASFTQSFTPTGLGRATLYVYMTLGGSSLVSSVEAHSSPSHPDGILGSSPAEDMFKAYFSPPHDYNLNPIYPTPLEAYAYLAPIYQSLLSRVTGNLNSYIAENYTAGWYHHSYFGNCSKVKFTLRSDVFWIDGKPLTAADVYFTWIEMKKILASRTLPDPQLNIGWSKLLHFMDFKIFDPYNFEVLFDGYPTASDALDWAGSCWILPKHVWKGICLTGNPMDMAPDINMIGCGPRRLATFSSEGPTYTCVDNSPGSTVTTQIDSTTGTAITSPGFFLWYNVSVTVYQTSPNKFSARVSPGTTIDYEVRLVNLDASAQITVDETILEDGIEISQTTGITLSQAGTPSDTHVTSLTRMLSPETHEIKVTVCKPTVWNFNTTLYIWVTIPEDIVGKTLYDDMGMPEYPYKNELPSPDIKVDIKDVAIAAKAFGAYPSHARWSPVADINDDYKIDIKDIAAIAKKFGWVG